MPKPSSFYNKRYRAKYPEHRTTERKKNYAQTSGPEKNHSHRTQWQIWEIKLLEYWSGIFTDRELHKCLGRSVQAIQVMRSKLKRKCLIRLKIKK